MNNNLVICAGNAHPTRSVGWASRTTKSGFNRSILDQGWGFFSRLDWKALRLGGHVYKVPPHNTSRTCPICGGVSKDNRKTQATFKCVSCGHQGNADVIAAIIIKESGRSSLACGESEKNARPQGNSGRPKKPTRICGRNPSKCQ